MLAKKQVAVGSNSKHLKNLFLKIKDQAKRQESKTIKVISDSVQTNDCYKPKLKSYFGPMNLNATSKKSAEVLIEEIIFVLDSKKVKNHKTGAFTIACEKGIMIEINRVAKTEDLILMRIWQNKEEEMKEFCEILTRLIFERVVF